MHAMEQHRGSVTGPCMILGTRQEASRSPRSGLSARSPQDSLVSNLHRSLQQRIESRMPLHRDGAASGYKMLTRSAGTPGVSLPQFRNDLQNKFGMEVSAEDATRLFSSYDADSKGYITYHDFVKRAAASECPDRTGLWPATLEGLRGGQKRHTPRETSFAPVAFGTLEELEAAVQAKLQQLTTHPADMHRQGLRLLGGPRGKGHVLTVPQLAAALRDRLGLAVTDEQLRSLAAKHDPYGRGEVDGFAFLTSILPRDFLGKQWTEDSEAREVARAALQRECTEAGVEPSALPHSPRQPPWPVSAIEDVLRAKISQRTSSTGDQLRQATMLFRAGVPTAAQIPGARSPRRTDAPGSPRPAALLPSVTPPSPRAMHMVTPLQLQQELKDKFGCALTMREVQALFNKYDEGRHGTIDFPHFIASLMPAAYTSKTWVEEAEERTLRHQHATMETARSLAEDYRVSPRGHRSTPELLRMTAVR